MKPSLVAMVLCVLASSAAAQCIAPAQAQCITPATARTTPERAGADVVKTHAPASAGRATPSIISAAAAQDTGAPQVSPSAVAAASGAPSERNDSALLLAALALMCGIALRRNSTGNQ